MHATIERGGWRPLVSSGDRCKYYSVVVGPSGVKLYDIGIGGEGDDFSRARHRSALNEGNGGTVRYINCQSGRVEQAAVLPVDSCSDRAPSLVKAGVLEVHFPTPPAGRPAPVAVKVRKN